MRNWGEIRSYTLPPINNRGNNIANLNYLTYTNSAPYRRGIPQLQLVNRPDSDDAEHPEGDAGRTEPHLQHRQYHQTPDVTSVRHHSFLHSGSFKRWWWSPPRTTQKAASIDFCAKSINPLIKITQVDFCARERFLSSNHQVIHHVRATYTFPLKNTPLLDFIRYSKSYLVIDYMVLSGFALDSSVDF